jgi:hypothetical protein
VCVGVRWRAWAFVREAPGEAPIFAWWLLQREEVDGNVKAPGGEACL